MIVITLNGQTCTLSHELVSEMAMKCMQSLHVFNGFIFVYCVFVCMFVRLCAYILWVRRMDVYVCMYVRTYACVYVCMYECMYVCTHVRVYICMHVCMCA